MKPKVTKGNVLGVLLVACLVGGGAATLASGAGAATPSGRAVTDQPHGANFAIKSGVDSNFCVQSIVGSSGTQLFLEGCNGAIDAQRWLMAATASGPFVALGAGGDCWDATTMLSSAVQVVPCTFRNHEKFVFNASSQIQNVSGSRCLTILGKTLVGGDELLVMKCDPSNAGQKWIFGH
jgi:hypothetical protein